MKTLVLVVAAFATSLAYAESELEVRVNRIEMSVTAPDETEETAKEEAAETAGTKATDYNSSRSNNTSDTAAAEGADIISSQPSKSRALDADSDNDSIEAEVCSNGVDNDCDSDTGVKATDHNSSRSNKTSH